jgi:hypothetical protein
VALVVLGLLVSLGGLASIADDPDDDDVGLGLAIGALVNLAGWTIGLVAAGAAARRRR